MNERIRELADQAELTIRDSRGNTYMSHPEFNKKFAELIIQECLFKANGAKIRGESIDELIQRIKEDFGVEE